MARQATDRIHSLELPIGAASLVIPSANIAEVINVGEITPVPHVEPWLLGALGWRQLAVPVIAFETLLGARAQGPQPNSKLVIFYPLRGRREWEFFGLLSTAEPRPHSIDSANSFVASGSELPNSSFIAGGIKIGGRLMLIPDLEALRQTFYGPS